MASKLPASIYPGTCSNNVWTEARQRIDAAHARWTTRFGWRRVVAVAFFWTISSLSVAASAHPAGFTSVNRYVGLECDGNGVIHIAYLLDFAEMPSVAEIDNLDANHDGTLTPSEQRTYLDRRLPPLLEAWTVRVNGAAATLRIAGSNLEVRDGERGMSTLRVAAEITAERRPPVGAGITEIYVDASDPGFSDRPGWREMAADDSPDAVLTGGNKEQPLDALAYGSAPTQAPPRIDHAEFTFRRAHTPVARPPSHVADWPVAVDPRLASLSATMRRANGGWTFSAIALALAALLGAGHALSPGHGKAFAAAYLVGRRARVSHAVVFGVTVTVAHTAVVFAIGLFAVAIEHMVGSHRVIRGLELASALAVLMLGLAQLSMRLRDLTSHGDAHGHEPVAPSLGGTYSIVALGTSAGAVPCPSGLAVLFAAIALHRYGFGLMLVLAFSGGIAVTLSATGVLVVMARRLLERISLGAPLSEWLRWLPVAASACVASIGVLLCISACSPQ